MPYNNFYGGGVHSRLQHLDWSKAKHIMDATLDMNSNDVDDTGDIVLNSGKKIYFDGT